MIEAGEGMRSSVPSPVDFLGDLGFGVHLGINISLLCYI